MRNHVLRGLALSVSIVVVLASSGCLTCVWADWPVIETVDSGGNVGVDTSLSLDSNDLSHISYFDGTTKT